MMNKKTILIIGTAFVAVAILSLILGFKLRSYQVKLLADQINRLELLHTSTFNHAFRLTNMAQEEVEEECSICEDRIILNQVVVLFYREKRMRDDPSGLWVEPYLESMDLLKQSGRLSDFYVEVLPSPLKRFSSYSNPKTLEEILRTDTEN